MLPDYAGNNHPNKYTKHQMDEAKKWLGILEDKMDDNFKVSFNTKKKEYTMMSDAVDAKGRPLYEWHYADGKETFTKRAADGSETTIIQK